MWQDCSAFAKLFACERIHDIVIPQALSNIFSDYFLGLQSSIFKRRVKLQTALVHEVVLWEKFTLLSSAGWITLKGIFIFPFNFSLTRKREKKFNFFLVFFWSIAVFFVLIFWITYWLTLEQVWFHPVTHTWLPEPDWNSKSVFTAVYVMSSLGDCQSQWLANVSGCVCWWRLGNVSMSHIHFVFAGPLAKITT